MFPGVVETLVTRFRLTMMCTSIIRRLFSPAFASLGHAGCGVAADWVGNC